MTLQHKTVKFDFEFSLATQNQQKNWSPLDSVLDQDFALHSSNRHGLRGMTPWHIAIHCQLQRTSRHTANPLGPMLCDKTAKLSCDPVHVYLVTILGTLETSWYIILQGLVCCNMLWRYTPLRSCEMNCQASVSKHPKLPVKFTSTTKATNTLRGTGCKCICWEPIRTRKLAKKPGGWGLYGHMGRYDVSMFQCFTVFLFIVWPPSVLTKLNPWVQSHQWCWSQGSFGAPSISSLATSFANMLSDMRPGMADPAVYQLGLGWAHCGCGLLTQRASEWNRQNSGLNASDLHYISHCFLSLCWMSTGFAFYFSFCTTAWNWDNVTWFNMHVQ